MINIIVNDKKQLFDNNVTLQNVLKHNDFSEDDVMVKYNGILIKKKRYSDTKLKNNDTVDIIPLISGG